jgi:hypothetical protein
MRVLTDDMSSILLPINWPFTYCPFTDHLQTILLTGHLLTIYWPFTYSLRRRLLLLCHRRSLNSNRTTASTAESKVAEPLRAVESSSDHDYTLNQRLNQRLTHS